MHSALLVDEVLRQILDLCPRTCLPAVARTCRSWTDPALDNIWSHIGSLVPLLCLIPGLTCVDGVYDVVGCEGSLDLGVFNSYARRIKHITQRHNTRIHPELLSLLCAHETPLTRLTTTRLSSIEHDCVPATLSLSPRLQQLDLDLGFRRKGPDGGNDYIETLLRVATGIERLRLRGLADQRLNSGISRMSNLRSLSLHTGAFLTAETLACISVFPHLSELEIEAGHIDPDALLEAWSAAAAEPRFPTLKKLHICAQAPLLGLVLRNLPPASLHALRIEATTDPAGAAPIRWGDLFDLLTSHTYTLHDLTIEQHLEDIELDLDNTTPIPAPSTPVDTQHDRLTFDTLRRLAPLHHLRRLTIDTTRLPNLSDAEMEALAGWWPALVHLDLGALHSSECVLQAPQSQPQAPSPSSTATTSTPRATLACLRAFAAMPELQDAHPAARSQLRPSAGSRTHPEPTHEPPRARDLLLPHPAHACCRRALPAQCLPPAGRGGRDGRARGAVGGGAEADARACRWGL
ncbi:hypothetical protein B0H14DRAFT_2707971, partial [Mycena olivaceomarginata]